MIACGCGHRVKDLSETTQVSWGTFNEDLEPVVEYSTFCIPCTIELHEEDPDCENVFRSEEDGKIWVLAHETRKEVERKHHGNSYINH